MITNSNCSRLLTLSISLSCNLKCIYCYENKSNKVFSVSNAIQLLKNELSKKTDKGTVIKLHGGEPFLVFTKLKELCESLWNAGIEEEFVIHTTTNGTLVHGEIQNWLYQNREKIFVKLSIDGDKYSHDFNRSNSFDQIDIPFFVNTWPDIRVNMTITPQTAKFLYHNVVFLHSVGFKEINTHFECLREWDAIETAKILHTQLIKLVGFYLDNPNLKPCLLLRHHIENVLDDDFDNALCAIGRKRVYDFETHCCYPCHMFFPSVTGHELDESINQIDFSKRSCIEHSDCLKCSFVNICFTCYAENYIMRGNVSNRNMDLCILNKVSFLATCILEYHRIIGTSNPEYADYQKMRAIHKLSHELCLIEDLVN